MKQEEFIHWIDSLEKSEPFLSESQRKAKQSLKEEGLPSKQLEEWRITNIERFKRILKIPIANKKHTQSIKLNFDKTINVKNLPDSIEILSEDEILKYYSNNFDGNNNLLNIFNQAINNDIIGLKVKSTNTINLDLTISNLEKELSPTKIIIVVENNCQLNLLQVIKGSILSAHSHLIEIHLKENSTVNHNFVAIGKKLSNLLGTIKVKQKENSNYSLITFQEGWYLSRLEKKIVQLDGKANTTIKSLSIAKDNEELASHTYVKFKGPNGSLNQLNKAIVEDESHYIFDGLIEVPKVAQKTQASQLSKNLLLSSKGRINTIPKLKIIADDVKCSHGATISQLEENQIFYLQSRGINKDQANSLLIKGFCQEITNNIKLTNDENFDLYEHLRNSK